MFDENASLVILIDLSKFRTQNYKKGQWQQMAGQGREKKINEKLDESWDKNKNSPPTQPDPLYP